MTQLRQSMRLILAAILTYGLSSYLPWRESYWIIITALFALHIGNNPLVRHKNFFLASTALIAASMAAISSLITPWVFCLATFLLITTFCTVSVGMWWPAYWGGAFIANYYANLSSGFATNLEEAMQRFLAILTGFVLAILLQTLFFPNRAINDCKLSLAECLQQLLELNQAVFDCLLAADYTENMFHYEKQLHKKRRDYSYDISIARQLMNQLKPKDKDQILPVLNEVERIYEIILSMGLLDFRVEDRATLELITKEFLAIGESIQEELHALKIQLLKKKPPASFSEKITENIYQLQDVSRSTLDIAAKDPMVFLLFVQDLIGLRDKMEQLKQHIMVLQDNKKC